MASPSADDMVRLFERPACGRSALNQQRSVIAELFLTAFTAPTDFRDARVCRHFLAGLCTIDLYFRLKLSSQPCTQVHDGALADAYDAARRSGAHGGYEAELTRHLEEIVQRNDREGFMRAGAEGGAGGAIPRVCADVHPNIDEFSRAVDATQAALDAANAAQMVRLEEELVVVKRRRCEALARVMRTAVNSDTKQRLCATCGTVLTLVDNDDRASAAHRGRRARLHSLTRPPLSPLSVSPAPHAGVADHFQGRVHLSMSEVRSAYYVLVPAARPEPPHIEQPAPEAAPPPIVEAADVPQPTEADMEQ
jgi:hypothetical protein